MAVRRDGNVMVSGSIGPANQGAKCRQPTLACRWGEERKLNYYGFDPSYIGENSRRRLQAGCRKYTPRYIHAAPKYVTSLSSTLPKSPSKIQCKTVKDEGPG